MSLMVSAAALLAAEEEYEAGPTALLVIVLLAIGILLLAKSMRTHLRRVPASFDPPETEQPVAGSAEDQPPEEPADGEPRDRP